MNTITDMIEHIQKALIQVLKIVLVTVLFLYPWIIGNNRFHLLIDTLPHILIYTSIIAQHKDIPSGEEATYPNKYIIPD